MFVLLQVAAFIRPSVAIRAGLLSLQPTIELTRLENQTILIFNSIFSFNGVIEFQFFVFQSFGFESSKICFEYYSVALFHQILVIKPVTHRQVCVRKCEIQAGIYFCVWPFLSLRLPAHCYDYANIMRGQVNDYHTV